MMKRAKNGFLAVLLSMAFGVFGTVNVFGADRITGPPLPIVPRSVPTIEIDAHRGRALPFLSSAGDSVITYRALVPTNTFLPTDALGPTGPFVELGDDVHMTSGGLMTAFTFGYFDDRTDTTLTVTANLTFYENDADNNTLGPVLAGPYVIPDLPVGFGVFRIAVPDSPVLGPHVWFGIDMDPGTAGPVVSEAPTIGSSGVIFIDTNPPGSFTFNGGPAAVWMLEIEIDARTVAVETKSWSEIKALYARP